MRDEMHESIPMTWTEPSTIEPVGTAVGAPWLGRVWARLFAGHYDHQVDAGVRVLPNTPLSAHLVRLVSRRERGELAQALTNVMCDAGLTADVTGPTRRVPIRVDAVRESADVVADVLAQLLGPLPVRARGMARLRILLSDGRGPVYSPGPGTLTAAMRGVLAAL